MLTRGDYSISTDPTFLDIDAIHAYLTRSYWSPGIPRDIVTKGLTNCLPFGVYHTPHGATSAKPTQIGLARVITDKATFAYLSDVFILEAHRGQGLSKWLMEVILAHPDLQNLRRFCLQTRDAHSLYSRFGFTPMDKPANYLERLNRNIYAAPTPP